MVPTELEWHMAMQQSQAVFRPVCYLWCIPSLHVLSHNQGAFPLALAHSLSVVNACSAYDRLFSMFTVLRLFQWLGSDSAGCSQAVKADIVGILQAYVMYFSVHVTDNVVRTIIVPFIFSVFYRRCHLQHYASSLCILSL